ncbi:MAG: retention module-containing protein [Methylophilaceae bacterium]
MAETKQVNAGTKLESIGTVKTVVGEVKAVDAAGNERILQAGDKVFANETIVTATGGLVLIEFADGSHLDLASASQIILDTDVFNPANAAPKGEELTAEQIQEMIARGEDPTAVTEATAAGAGAGDEGGSSFIQVDFNNTQGNVTSGFNTLGIPGPEATTFTELPPVEDDAVPTPTTTIIGSLLEIELDVEAQGIPEGSSVVYTVTIDNASTGDITITLSNGAVIVIPAGELSGSSDPIPVQGDDPYVDPSEEAVHIVSMTGGGANEVLEFDPAPVEFEVIDTINTTTLTLNDVTVSEGPGTATITASLDHAPQSTLVVTLNNGATITFGTDYVAGTPVSSTAFAINNGEDVYKDGSSFELSVASTNGGGNFENLVTSDKATVTVGDTKNTVTATLSTSTTEISENGGEIVYTVTLSGGPGVIDPDTNLVFKLANGEQVTIPAGQLSGSFTKVYTNADITNQPSISNSITSVESGGSEFEDLVTTGTTNVDVDYGVTITNLTPQANGGDVIVDEDDLTDGNDSAKESTTVPGTFTITAPDGVQNLTIGSVAIITNGVFTAATITSALGNTLSVTSYDAGTGVVSYTYTLNDNTTTHAAADGENSVYENFPVEVTDTDNDTNSATLSVQIVDDVPITTFAEDTTVSTASGSDSGSLGITIGADLNGATVTIIASGQVLDANGAAVTSNGANLLYFSNSDGSVYAATSENGAHVLEFMPSIATDGTVSYTVEVTGVVDANTDVSEIDGITATVTKTVQTGTETVATLHEDIITLTDLKPTNYQVSKGDYLSLTGVNGDVGLTFYGYKDADSTAGNNGFTTATDVQVSTQRVGADTGQDISNTSGGGDGELMKLVFTQGVYEVKIDLDGLNSGETGYYSIDGGLNWIAVSGTGTGSSDASDEHLTITASSIENSFTQLWFKAADGSDYGIDIDSNISVKYYTYEEVPVYETTTETLSISVRDVTGEDQTVTLNAQASDGDSDLSGLVSFDTTLDSAVDYDAVTVDGDEISNFSVEQGDALDFTEIFGDSGMSATELFTGGYLTVAVNDTDHTATISVDLDAGSTAYTSTQVVTLTNLDSGITAAQIINQIITENP